MIHFNHPTGKAKFPKKGISSEFKEFKKGDN